ncbi:NADPH-dependent ferric siderophore reductase [Rhodococcus sp. OK611]|uniref:siderophore-interacting protein n=1 Tax=unclassified Rhodococcus (in: high G+C Gram-positive bacteria) TaxID=192944 RepID=UPI000BCF1DAD|nr:MULTISPECIES: siderophore-interacting protein [unclassified Rhodococcus (in: high G+C Gram-positive bacteria)]PTR40552.1 NADPH-dependent ferric siderophore reductase [Rhodococcus sp. OK611]SNX92243.1 NADPH-dependent ferric siderophore reductase, contains FAD-binding and SIP domains [Rhodococcus sp. OK270]
MARRITTLTVSRTQRLTPHLVRVYLGDPGFEEFVPNDFTDAYVKLIFGPDDDQVLRTYTVSSVDDENREVAIDFVVHGDEGVAAPWAASAQPGESVRLYGPGGAYAPRADADWHLLAGDESAIPAVAAAVAALPADAVARVVLEVAGPDDEVPLPSPAPVQVTWVHRGGAADEVGDDRAGDNAPLIEAVKAVPWLPGQPHVFIHGEAHAVMHGLRAYIRKERGVAAEWASISGYWRRGRTEEGFRVWKSELAATDNPERPR